LAASPALATVASADAAAAGALLAAAAGAADAVADEESVELDESADFEHPVTSRPPSAATATSVTTFACMELLSRPNRGTPSHFDLPIPGCDRANPTGRLDRVLRYEAKRQSL
jgi:hypothetical protein